MEPGFLGWQALPERNGVLSGKSTQNRHIWYVYTAYEGYYALLEVLLYEYHFIEIWTLEFLAKLINTEFSAMLIRIFDFASFSVLCRLISHLQG
jgi:hypothetical protein